MNGGPFTGLMTWNEAFQLMFTLLASVDMIWSCGGRPDENLNII